MNRNISAASASPGLVVLCAVALLATACSRSPKPRLVEWPFDPTYAALDRLLAKNATPEGFRYKDLAINPADLKILKLELAEVTKAEYDAFSREARMAFLINAHNVHAIDRIVQAWPVSSIEDTEWLGSAIEARDLRLAGRKWSLLDIRKELMGTGFRESRAIFMLNWGMRGCPPLPPVAATPENLNMLMERQTAAFIQDDQFNLYIRDGRRFRASSLLETWRPEIERDYTTLHLFLVRFSAPEVAAMMRAFPPRIDFQPFETALNEAVELPLAPRASAQP